MQGFDGPKARVYVRSSGSCYSGVKDNGLVDGGDGSFSVCIASFDYNRALSVRERLWDQWKEFFSIVVCFRCFTPLSAEFCLPSCPQLVDCDVWKIERLWVRSARIFPWVSLLRCLALPSFAHKYHHVTSDHHLYPLCTLISLRWRKIWRNQIMLG